MAERVINSLASRILDLESRCIDDDASIASASRPTQQFVDDMRNVNTLLATKSHCRLFSNWLATKSEERSPEQLNPKELDLYLAQFTLTIRKEGDENINHPSRQYEPSTLSAMHNSLFRYLNSKDYGHNIKASELFKHSREVLSAKMKELKQLGKGNRPHASQSFTPDEITILVEKNIIGIGNPKAIINSMWLNSTLHFGLRGRQEHVDMMWGDMQLKTDCSGVEYLEFQERATKTRQGSTRNVRAFAPKMYSTGTDQCPVKVYKEFARRRPSDCCEPDSRFYLKPRDKPTPSEWFTRQPMGKNAIGTIAKNMALEADLSSANRTNHSGRKLAIQTLLHAGIPPTDVMQLTGHKNVQSLNSYSHLSIDQQRDISNMLTTKLSKSTVMSRDSHAAQAPTISAINAHSPSNDDFMFDLGINDAEMISIMDLPFDDEPVPSFNEQPCVKHLKQLLPLIPRISREQNNFLNGTINGNITININTVPVKRRRVKSDSEDSEE